MDERFPYLVLLAAPRSELLVRSLATALVDIDAASRRLHDGKDTLAFFVRASLTAHEIRVALAQATRAPDIAVLQLGRDWSADFADMARGWLNANLGPALPPSSAQRARTGRTD